MTKRMLRAVLEITDVGFDSHGPSCGPDLSLKEQR